MSLQLPVPDFVTEWANSPEAAPLRQIPVPAMVMAQLVPPPVVSSPHLPPPPPAPSRRQILRPQIRPLPPSMAPPALELPPPRLPREVRLPAPPPPPPRSRTYYQDTYEQSRYSRPIPLYFPWQPVA